MLGDCLLHSDHHEMGGACWDAAITHYVAFVDERLQRPGVPDMDAINAEGRERYKADYERALLNKVRAEAANG